MSSYYSVAYSKNGVVWNKGAIESNLPIPSYHSGRANNALTSLTFETSDSVLAAVGPIYDAATHQWQNLEYRGKVSAGKLAWENTNAGLAAEWRSDGSAVIIHNSFGGKSEPWLLVGNQWRNIREQRQNSFVISTPGTSAVLHDWGFSYDAVYTAPCAVHYDSNIFVFVTDVRNGQIHYFIWDGGGDPLNKSSWVIDSVIPDQLTYQQVSAAQCGDRLFVAYYDSNGNGGWLTSFKQENWSRPVKFTENMSLAPSLVVFRGLLHIIYSGKADNTPNSRKLHYRTFDGNSFSEEIVAGPDVDPVWTTPICASVPGLNSIVAVYLATDPNSREVALYPA